MLPCIDQILILHNNNCHWIYGRWEKNLNVQNLYFKVFAAGTVPVIGVSPVAWGSTGAEPCRALLHPVL